MAFAKGTEVPIEKTETEIKALLRKYKADAFGSFESAGSAMIAFEMNKRRIVFKLPLPDPKEKRFTEWRKPVFGQPGPVQYRDAASARKVWDQECREKWRSMLLCIKAKLESVESGIETFEDAFLAHVQMPGGQTIGEMIRPQIAEQYASGKMGTLMLGAPDGN